jgi:hypothetical protein
VYQWREESIGCRWSEWLEEGGKAKSIVGLAMAFSGTGNFSAIHRAE